VLGLKRRAVRSGVWFRALRRIDRALVNAVLQVVVDGVHNPYLAKSVLSIMTVLQNAIVNRGFWRFNEVGYRLAYRLGLIAQSWGNASADSWARDLSFVRFLAAMHVSDGIGDRIC